ncbi:MAG: hypothetical protein ABIP55_11060 [Tepidisphaeraceae bacterium]
MEEIARLNDALPALLRAHPAVAALLDRSALLLHGSTTIGIDDPLADWDLWVLTDMESWRDFDREHGTRFIEFRSVRKGHFQIEPIDAFRHRVARCDFQLISELRHALVLSDPRGIAAGILADSCKPMSEQVRRAWFCHHYVEMRGEHRACDNAIDRGGHAFAVLLGATRALEHALQAAMILDGEPYRYGKWLTTMAARTPTGAGIVPLVHDAMRLIASGAIDHPGPEAAHPLTLMLKEIRRVLIDAARAAGIDEPWLNEWWLHIDKARDGVRDVTWE